jgi:amidase
VLELQSGNIDCEREGAACEGIVAPVDDDVVRRLRAAGGVLTGKTTTPEFGLACFTESDVAPPARNPWSPERTAGGAGGGAAVAVAAGLAPVAHGLDGIGSLRVPAAACGVVGFKPSRGRIPAEAYAPDPFGLSSPGVVTRTVADAAMLLDVMAGAAEGYWTPAGQARSFTAHAQRDPGVLRVGCTTAGAVPGAEPDPEIRIAFDETKALLEELGHHVVDVAPALGPDSAAHVDALWFAAAHLHSVRSSRAHQLRPLTSWLRGMGRRAGSALLQAHDELLRGMRTALPRQEAAVDVVLTPTLAQAPPPIGWFTDEVAPPETFERMRAFSPYVTEANLTGRPSITLPLYWTSAGLPIGMMLTGHWGQEGTLLALGTQIEASRYLSRRMAAQHLTAA